MPPFQQLGPIRFAQLTTTDRDTQWPSPPDNLVIQNVTTGYIQIYLDGAWLDIATADDLVSHTGDAVDAHDASAISNVPAGTVAATTVQAAIDELATDYAAADSSHAGAADPHTGYRLESVALSVSKSVIFSSPSATLAVEDWLPDQAIRVPATGQRGVWTPGTFYVRVGTAGTGTNTILFRTSTTLTGARTTRATVNLGTAQEASATITWTPADGEYMWVAVSAVGATAPQKGVAQVDIVETAF